MKPIPTVPLEQHFRTLADYGHALETWRVEHLRARRDLKHMALTGFAVGFFMGTCITVGLYRLHSMGAM